MGLRTVKITSSPCECLAFLRLCGQGTRKSVWVETFNQSCAHATIHRPSCLHWGRSVMIVASKQSDVVALAGSSVGPRVYRYASAVLLQFLTAALCIVNS